MIDPKEINWVIPCEKRYPTKNLHWVWEKKCERYVLAFRYFAGAYVITGYHAEVERQRRISLPPEEMFSSGLKEARYQPSIA
jgi:hypothetical protein